MAGAGYKLFNTGDVLTAAQVNTYLQEQAVMRFASAAARTTALSGVLAEGMVSYLMDTNAVEVYDGSAWVGVGNVGDITGVTAGTGISGGGTSGTVTITNSMATEINAAGDIIVGTGSGTFDNLPIGTTGQVLTADTTVSPYKVKWATSASGGMTLLSTTTLSGSSTSISVSSGYKDLYIIVRNAQPGTNGTDTYMRLNSDSNARYNTWTAYNSNLGFGDTNWGSITYPNSSSGTTALYAITLYDYDNTSTYKLGQITAVAVSSTNTSNSVVQRVMGAYNQTGAITSVQFNVGGGTWTAGTVLVYGVK